MAQSTDRRPAVLSQGTVADLQDLLRLRHLVCNLYADELWPDAVERLRIQALALWPAVLADLQGFRQWLVETSEAQGATG